MTATNLTTLMRHRQTVCNANRITNAPAMNTIMEDELEYLYDYGRQIYDGDIRPTSSTSDVEIIYKPKYNIIYENPQAAY
ncbi:hypothetical protein E6Q11_02690 [Candidatus Dojkabacteria bacterium]|uniref:Uncharacterized protein n=1 Tax=Candidatus Dojkabacteria bacterium TaxID=2099670 RepID=A0A5C7J968_9BACT|nr:MAG: hypothetical protein E6Q11_02690 [Candidatus Dojkabacteria bacterium]